MVIRSNTVCCGYSLELPHGEMPGSKSAEGRIQLMSAQYFISQPFIIILPLSPYDLNNVERDVKHQITIIIYVEMKKNINIFVELLP